MGMAEWGADPEFFGPRHAHREGRIIGTLRRFARATGPHLECAAGVGSLSCALARRGREVVAADLSLRSLAELDRRVRQAGQRDRASVVTATVPLLPCPSGSPGRCSAASVMSRGCAQRILLGARGQRPDGRSASGDHPGAYAPRSYRLMIRRATCLTGSTRSSLWPICSSWSITTALPELFR